MYIYVLYRFDHYGFLHCILSAQERVYIFQGDICRQNANPWPLLKFCSVKKKYLFKTVLIRTLMYQSTHLFLSAKQ